MAYDDEDATISVEDIRPNTLNSTRHIIERHGKDGSILASALFSLHAGGEDKPGEMFYTELAGNPALRAKVPELLLRQWVDRNQGIASFAPGALTAGDRERLLHRYPENALWWGDLTADERAYLIATLHPIHQEHPDVHKQLHPGALGPLAARNDAA